MLGAAFGPQSTAMGGREALPLDAEPSRTASQGRDLWRRVKRYAAGEQVDHVATRDVLVVIVTGWACEMRVLPDGKRQIFSILLPGDLVCLRAGDDLASVALVALTRLEIADTAPVGEEAGLSPDTPGLIDALHQQSRRQLDHIVRLGSLTASERVIHLLLELHERLSAIGLVKSGVFRIPLTQEVFASVLGASVVHINRTLQSLRRQGLITLRSGSVVLHDVDRLATIACFQLKSA